MSGRFFLLVCFISLFPPPKRIKTRSMVTAALVVSLLQSKRVSRGRLVAHHDGTVTIVGFSSIWR